MLNDNYCLVIALAIVAVLAIVAIYFGRGIHVSGYGLEALVEQQGVLPKVKPKTDVKKSAKKRGPRN